MFAFDALKSLQQQFGGMGERCSGSGGVGAPRRTCSGSGSCLGMRRWVHARDPARTLAKRVSHRRFLLPRHALRAGVVW